ncbi:MAG: SDR family NAD(P)-dependent oxidoreductase [Acidimicrobiia bacterium]
MLVVGASRGIGLGLVEAHLTDGWTVHATTRVGASPVDHPNLIAHQFDVRDRDQLAGLVDALEPPLDRIIHNAGVMTAPRSEMMEVNSVAPIRTVGALLDAGLLRPGGVVAIMTSQRGARRGRSGSLGDYGDSKAALNDAFREHNEAWRNAGAIAVVIHPGWVKTDMGGASAPLTVAESVYGIKRLLDGVTPDDHGSFLTWDGRIHPW